MSKPALPSGDEDRLLLRHINDLSERSMRSGRALFTNFLDDRQLAICETALKSDKKEFVTLGGYDAAERRVIAFGYDGGELPFTAAVFNYRETDEQSHRDFLGSLMSLGIKRELLGDILVGTGRTAVFVINTALPLVSELEKIGKTGVRVSFDFSEEDIPEQRFEERTFTLASLRLDALVASALKMSREKSAELIRQKGAFLNRVQTFSPSERVEEGDKISLRGFGKFELSGVGGQSRKDRTVVTVKIYK